MLEVKVKLKEILKERGIIQKDLAQKANLREATVSEIVRGSRTVINFSHLAAIAEALDIKRIEDILEFLDKS